MIVKFSEGADRGQLGFAEAVAREFSFVEIEYGFRRVRATSTFVRYESEHMFLNAFHGRGSYEIGVELGRLSHPEERYRLPSLVAGLDPNHKGQTVFQASSRQVVERCVAKVARTLEVHCGGALAGEAEALRLVEQADKAESDRVTIEAQFGAAIVRADRAWLAMDLGRAAKYYQDAELALDETRQRRLRYLNGRKESSDR